MPILKFALLTAILFFFLTTDSFSAQRSLKISGLKIYTEEGLVRLLDLKRYETYDMSAEAVIYYIRSFYREQGYAIAEIYIIEKTDELLSLYVDEGRLNKILYLNLDDVNTLWTRWKFGLKKNIYNEKILRENCEALKKRRKYAEVRYKLKPAKSFDGSFFQLDRELNLPVIGKSRFPFMNDYGARYDLEISDEKYIPILSENTTLKMENINLEEIKKSRVTLNRFDFGLKFIYWLGLIPYVKYFHINLFTPGDGLKLGSDLGVMYGLDGKFRTPPRISFYKIDMFYLFTPTFYEYFTPFIRGAFYRSRASRTDLDLLQYDYRLINVLFAPGITLLSKMLIHAGVGEEFMTQMNSKSYPVKYYFANLMCRNLPYPLGPIILPAPKYYIHFKEQTSYYTFIESGIAFNIKPERLGNPVKQSMILVYNYYHGMTKFHKFRYNSHFDFEFSNRGIYTIKLDYKFMTDFNSRRFEKYSEFGNMFESIYGLNYGYLLRLLYGNYLVRKNLPFHHEANVSSMEFKGYMRRGYYTRNIFSFSNEYKISVYREFIYLGLYNDYTVFQGSGYNLPIKFHYATAWGPTIRVLLLDQFEFYFYYGWDLPLRKGVKTRDIKDNYTFNLYKKW